MRRLRHASLSTVNEPHVERYIVDVGYKQTGTSLRRFACIELDPDTTRDAIVSDIASGQIEADHFTVIWHASTTEPLRDVTRDIAEDVLRVARAELDADGYPTFGALTDFLENSLGCQRVQECAAQAMEAV